MAAKALQDMGMDNVCHVGGGFNAWKKADGSTAEYERKKKG